MNAFNSADVLPKRIGVPNMIPSAHSVSDGVGAPYSASILLLRSSETLAITAGETISGTRRSRTSAPASRAPSLTVSQALLPSRHGSKTQRECLLLAPASPSPKIGQSGFRPPGGVAHVRFADQNGQTTSLSFLRAGSSRSWSRQFDTVARWGYPHDTAKHLCDMAVIGKTASDTNLQYTDAGYLKQPARTVNPFLNRVLMRRKTDGFLERPPRNSARSCQPSMPTPLALFLVQDSHRAHLLGVLAAAPSECPVPLPEKRHTFCANELRER